MRKKLPIGQVVELAGDRPPGTLKDFFLHFIQ